MRTRLRPKYSDEQLKEVYSAPHNHHHWKDHILRVNATIQVAKWFENVKTVADLSCGDAAIAKAAGGKMILGDYAPGYEYTGPIEETIEQIPEVDLFICSETIEHLDDPDAVLKRIRTKTKNLVLSTPLAPWHDTNPEHYWAFDDKEIKEMLVASGFLPVVYMPVHYLEDGYMYNFQIWGAE